ncbi:hypothetical protein HU200_062856 [Digitaria exilis]|uniref:DELLA protein n=1 Tax=Digitaria exilis TaxID=1010633 RepID=A0A835A6U0_9POAL|nr:hypothetical protein HU200_062856 [Digitaria exilis]
MGMLNCVDTSSGAKLQQQQAPTSPHRLTGLQALKFDADIDVEIQSPDIAMWESLFAEQMGASGADFLYFMVSSPKRDYMVSSPKRDYMVSSPKRDYMMSSPKRELFTKEIQPSPTSTAPAAINKPMPMACMEQIRGSATPASRIPPTVASPNHGKGKSQSPLQKVYINNAVHSNGGRSNGPSSPRARHPTAMARACLCAIHGSLLNDGARYGEWRRYLGHGHHGGSHVIAAAFPRCRRAAATVAAGGLPMGGALPAELYYGGQFGGDGLTLQHQMAKSDHMLGSVIQSEAEQDSGLQLVHLLLACADFVSKGDQPSALRHLHLLRRVASPLGDSMQRVASYFADALAAAFPLLLQPFLLLLHLIRHRYATRRHRLRRRSLHVPTSPDTLKIYQILYQACPYIKFAHFTANQAIFEAFHGEDRVHVVDLDILQGYQWPAFLPGPRGPARWAPDPTAHRRGHPAAAVRETGRHLASLAASLRVPFEFHAAVADRSSAYAPPPSNDVSGRPSRQRRQTASTVFCCAQDHDLVEQELATMAPTSSAGAALLLRPSSTSLDATFPADSAPRMKVEQCLLAPEIRNVVACEGAERVARHERLDRWRRLMEGPPAAVGQSQVLLGLYGAGDGMLLLGWQDRAIIAASAWRC